MILSLLVVALLVSTLGVLAHPALSTGTAGLSSATELGGTSTHSALTAAVHPSATHGDLVVNAANSPYVINPSTTGAGTYNQAGNISVLSGGSLRVENETLTVFSFVGATGSFSARLSHLYWISVQGTATFANSVVTTDDQSLYAYAKLYVNVSGGGTLHLIHTAFEFPGWVSVYGAGSLLELNASNLSKNPSVVNQPQNQTILHDALYGPALSVLGGARAVLADSAVPNAYKDNITQWGNPAPAPLFSNVAKTLTSSAGATWSTWTTALPDTENLTRDVLAHSAASGSIILNYSTAVDTTIPSGSSIAITSAAGLGSISFPATGSSVTVPMPSALLTQINASGVAGFFGAGVLTLGVTNQATGLDITSVVMTLNVELPYNITVSGAGTRLTAINSALDLNWNLTPGTPVVPATQYPFSWGSSKLNLENGAQAYLANVSVTEGRHGLFWNTSAVQPDASSNAYFYRWLVIPVTGLGGAPVAGAQGLAFYSYDSNQLNNATASALNNLASADPDLYLYATAAAGPSGYGVSNPQGMLWLLLAASTLTQSTVPNGLFLGGYHVSVTLPGGGAGTTQWSYSSVTPYPLGMTPAAPDSGNGVNYASYAPNVVFNQVSVTVQGQPSAPVVASIGQTVNVSVDLKNTGTGPAPSLIANLTYLSPFTITPSGPAAPSQRFPTLLAGGNQTINFTWLVSQTSSNASTGVGLHGWINTTLQLSIVWAGGAAPAGGVIVDVIDITVAPSHVSVTLTAPGGEYDISGEYPATGDVHYNGTGSALITVWAVGSSGEYPIGRYTAAAPGPFTMTLTPDPAQPPGQYTLIVNATFNARSARSIPTATITIPGAATTSPPFWEQSYFGLPLWIWIAIGAAAVIGGLVGFLLLSRRSAAGKLVECGECGELIPEDATVCPKCGAEFETGLVRCSRCNSTIPADSKVCPECAAQLLGKPEEAANDPERQGYADFVERYRAEAKKELQDNYSEGAFWDWWKRQPTYVAFSQWRLLQSQGSRAGMTAPPTGEPAAAAATPTTTPPPRPPRGGGGAAAGAAAAAAARPAPTPPPAAPPPAARKAAPAVTPAPAATAAPAEAAAPAATAAPAASPGMKACSNCSKEIPADYLVCPFCGAVTR